MKHLNKGVNGISLTPKQNGAGVIKGLLTIPLVLLLILALVIAFYEGRKAYWDYQVQQMCEEDGGTVIYEKVLLDRMDAEAKGLMDGNDMVIPSYTDAGSTMGYYIDYESTDIRPTSPRVFRARTTIVRMIDNKTIAEMIVYSRVGGDSPTYAHPSSVSCRDADNALLEFRTAVQIKEKMQ